MKFSIKSTIEKYKQKLVTIFYNLNLTNAIKNQLITQNLLYLPIK